MLNTSLKFLQLINRKCLVTYGQLGQKLVSTDLKSVLISFGNCQVAVAGLVNFMNYHMPPQTQAQASILLANMLVQPKMYWIAPLIYFNLADKKNSPSNRLNPAGSLQGPCSDEALR